MADLLKLAPAAAFYLLALAAQFSGFTSAQVALLLALVGTLLLIWPALNWLAAWLTRRGRRDDREESLDIILPWIADQSAWGRWQRALEAMVGSDQMKLNYVASAVWRKAQTGKLALTARKSKAIERETLSVDFWKVACIEVIPDKARIWKVMARPCDGISKELADQIRSDDYVGLCAKWGDVTRLWPQKRS